MTNPINPADAVREALPEPVREAIRIFDQSAARTYPNKQTEAWEVLLAHIVALTTERDTLEKHLADAMAAVSEQDKEADRLAALAGAAPVVFDASKLSDEDMRALMEPGEYTPIPHALAGAAPVACDTTERLVSLLRSRDAMGRKKYGTSLDRTDLTAEEWLQHLTEELLDAAGYAQSLIRTHAPAKAREVTEDDVERAVRIMEEYDSDALITFAGMRAALATFAEGA